MYATYYELAGLRESVFDIILCKSSTLNFSAVFDEIYIHGPVIAIKINWKIEPANKIKRITYLTSGMAESRQECHTSDGAVKIKEKVSLKGLILLRGT